MYDSENDTFRLEFLLVPVIGLSFLENYEFTPLEVRDQILKNQERCSQDCKVLPDKNCLYYLCILLDKTALSYADEKERTDLL